MFREALHICSLTDLGFEGDKFTWSNNQDESNHIKARLDRFITMVDWKTSFPRAIIYHLLRFASDHMPILIDLNPSKGSRNSNPIFRDLSKCVLEITIAKLLLMNLG